MDTGSEQPSERDFLWPELVEEDFVETVGILRRYADQRSFFRLDQLEAHLLHNNVRLPGDDLEWIPLFAEMREAVVEQLSEQGEEAKWVYENIGEIMKYTLEHRPRPQEQTTPAPEAAVETVLPPRTVKKRVPLSEVEVAEDLPPHHRRTLDRLTESPQTLRPSEWTSMLSETSGESPDTVDKLIQVALASGILHKAHIKGIAYYSSTPPESSSGGKQHVESGDIPAERPITEEELRVAVAIMDELAAASTDIARGKSIKELESMFRGEVPARILRKLLQNLEAQRLIKAVGDGNRKTHKAPRVTIRGRDMRQRWRANRDSYVKRLSTITLPNKKR